tara:strand:+ start:1849 stop:2319 length:471 start_codon:yes stop_codon:yes gene_type:complete
MTHKSDPRYTITWDVFHQDIEHLAQKLDPLGPWERIIAVARGGLAPAAYLSQRLNIRLVETVCLASYFKEGAQSELEILKDIDDHVPGTLIVDDLVDSGKTFSFLKDRLPNAHRAVVYAKPRGQALADTLAREVEQEKWLVFPWEEKPFTCNNDLR